MEKKNLCGLSLGMLAAAFLLGLLKNVLRKVYIFVEIYAVAAPLLLIAAGICGYLVFRDRLRFPGKLIWAVLGMLLGLVFQKLELVSYGIFVSKAPALQSIGALLFAAGGICVILSVPDEKFRNLQYIGLAVLAVSALCGGLNAAALIQCLMYGALALILLNLLPGYDHIIRTAAVILAVLGISAMGYIAAACWILFAFILVPADKNRQIRFSFARVTALLFALTAVLGIAAFLSGKPMLILENRKSQIVLVEKEIETNEKKIPDLQDNIVKYEDKISLSEKELQNAKDNVSAAEVAVTLAKQELADAEAALDKVCHRNSYSYWYCDYDCRQLHNAVDDKADAIDDAQRQYRNCEANIEEIESDISYYKKTVKDLEREIKNTEKHIEDLKQELSVQHSLLWAERFKVLVNIITAVLTAASLLLFAVCFFRNSYGNRALLACGIMALSALLPLLGNRYDWSAAERVFLLLTMPNLWRMVIAGLLAAIFTNKDGKLIRYRVLVIIAAVILAVPALLHRTGAVSILYAVTVICAALVLVPPVFTEYNSIAKHLFFTFISLGIWQLIWVYHVTRNLNRVSSVEYRKPSSELLLSMFLPFYYSYWILKTAENVEVYAAENGKQYKLDVISFVFAFICPLVSTVLLQNKINQIVGKPE